MKKISDTLKIINEKKLYPNIGIVTGGVSSEPEFEVNGKRVLSFCSGNYLGLANNQEVKQAIIDGLNTYGIHPSGSVLISGTLAIHRELEKRVANFIGNEDAILFATSTMANMGVIPALINLPLTSLLSFFRVFFKKDGAIIFSDEFNHATVIEGCRLAKAERVLYKHCDMNDLESKLKKNRSKRKLIVSDGIFSMDGDIAPLKDLVALAKKYGAILMIDDAHSTGVLGKHGRGIMEHFGLKDGVDIIVTTFSKAVGVVGGAAIASADIVKYFRVSAKTYIFSGAFLGGLAQGILKSLEIIENDKIRRKKLWENTNYLKHELEKAGLNTLKSKTPIIPILIGEEKKAIGMSNDLFERGILSPPIRWPAVPHGESRMRFTLTPNYSKKQLDKLVTNLTELGKHYHIIR